MTCSRSPVAAACTQPTRNSAGSTLAASPRTDSTVGRLEPETDCTASKRYMHTTTTATGSLVMAVGEVEADVQQRVLEGSKVLGAVRSILKGRTMSWVVKKTLY